MRWLLAACLLFGCKEEPDPRGSDAWQAAEWPSPLEDGTVLQFVVDAPVMHETTRVDREGHIDYRRLAHNQDIEVTLARPLAELERVRDTLSELGCCEMTSEPAGEEGVGTGRLVVRLPDLSCDVTLQMHTWEDMEQPGGCERAVRSLHGRPRQRLPN